VTGLVFDYVIASATLSLALLALGMVVAACLAAWAFIRG
jgi:hypothetical protein